MFRSDYIEACRRYPTKPQVLWELGAEAQGNQSGWMDSALEALQTKYSRVKAIMFDEHPSHGYNPVHNESTIKVIRKHFSSGYFIGNALK
jgi:hypothetical protein